MKKYLDFIYFNRKEIITVLIMLSLFGIYYFTSNNKESIKEEIVIEKEVSSKLVVDIKGEVKTPGVYELDNGKRINDVITLAGGLTVDADVSNINLSEKITDGMLINIPKKEELIEEDETIKETKKEVVTTTSKDNKISINNASLNELMKINGIGRVKAESIINYRNTNGKFKSIEELTKVNGIGKATFEKIKDYIKL